MKVGFVICTLGHGKGGHFHSLAVIAAALQRRNIDCVILNIGFQPSKVLQDSSVPFEFEPFDGHDLLGCRRRLIERLSILQPDVLHSFDVASHFWARILGSHSGLPVVHNKCGGPNPRRYYPFATCIVTFSQENTEYFEQSRWHRDSRIEHIPNRSMGVVVDYERVRRLAELCDTESKKIMRISRFSAAYKRSLIQAIDLVNGLNDKSSERYQLILIGAVQDNAVYEAICAQANGDVLLVTDDYFTHVASELLGFADAVVATGRGVMEAASLGKVILVPSDKNDLPVLMTTENIEELFARNFSPRVDPAQPSSIENVVTALTYPAARKKLETESRRLFDEKFLVDTAVAGYIAIYKGANVDTKKRYLDLALNFLVVKRYFGRARRANSNRVVPRK